MNDINKIQMRKRNMRLFPIYKMLSWDYIFYYTIIFLFLTQVKNIDPADVILLDSFYFIFSIFAQLPSTFMIEFFGRRNSIVIANVLNCIYIVIVIFSQSLLDLVVGKIIESIAFSIKNSVEPSLLNESIPPSKAKGRIFAKINEYGMSRYYIINAISMIFAGFLYEINPYIPIVLSLLILIIVTILSTYFIEPVDKNHQKIRTVNQIQEVREAFKFVLKSERIKSLILFASVMGGLLIILQSYQVSMLEDLNIPAMYLGILFAVLGILSAQYTKQQEKFHNRYRNKSLTLIGLITAGTCIFGGLAGVIAKQYIIAILVIIVSYAVQYIVAGIYHPLIEKYLSNFANKKIDTKIFTANNLLKGIVGAIATVFASYLLGRMETAYCMIAIGLIFGILFILISKFMKTRVGLKPKEYPKEEVKYDKLKEII